MTLPTASQQQLRAFIERVERLEEEKKAIGDDIKAVYAEAKANGYDTKAMRTIVKLRKLDIDERNEQATIVQTYMQAVGMDTDTPLYTAISALAVDKTGRDSMIEALKQLAPADGEIILAMGGPRVRLWRDPEGVPHADDVVDEAVAPRERVGKVVRIKPATVLSIVPRTSRGPTKDQIKDIADRAEGKTPAPAEGETSSEDESE